MEQYIQKELWTEEEYGVGDKPKKKTDEASLWLNELGAATQVKQLIALADSCHITPSKEQPTFWYTSRYLLTLKKKTLEAKVEVEQDSPYEKVRIMSIWVNAENLI